MMTCNLRDSTLLFLWLLTLTHSFNQSCSADSGSILCLESERLALLRFKEDLIVPSDRLMSWTASQPDCCNWPEVLCDNFTGHVKELHLQAQKYSDRSKLQGKINSCLLELKYLEHLDLSYNDFGRIPIPKFIGSMVSLTYLSILEVQFQGLIPHQLGNLSNLQHLSISGNLYVENLHWLKNLSSLVHLDFDGVDLSAASHEWLGNMNSLPSLLELQLSGCQLAFIPSAHTINFTSLSVLDLAGNSFVNYSIPRWILSLSKLKSLDLDSSDFIGSIPNGFSNLSSLSSLILDYNNLGGEISKVIENISGCNLRVISLSNNNFSGSLSEYSFHRLTSLTVLDLSSNRLVGNIPQTLGTLSYLEKLEIDNNMLEGIVSEFHFRNLTKLTYLDGSNNNLTLKLNSNWVPPFHLQSLDLSRWSIGPQFPQWLQTQHDLSYLDLSSTEISDSVPSWFWNLSSQLDYLNLSHNQISGQLPSGLGSEIPYQFYSYIYLSSNQFTGLLPKISRNITELDLSNNSFSGPVSVLLCNPMSQVNELSKLLLGDNNLSGDIADCWKYWQSLEVINLENNHLTGNIPNSIAHLTQLLSLHLRNNNLFGNIPASLQNCSRLQFLDLGFNYFVGNLPTWLGSFSNLIILSLHSNNLEGKIPPKFCHLISLQILDLSGNNLSSYIPTCINNLTSMTIVQNSTDLFSYDGYVNSFVENALVVIKGREDQYGRILPLLTSIDLSMNKLSGDIPREMSALLGLRYLNLSGNKLTGEIPDNIGDMRVLESFDLSRNRISGRIPSGMSSMYFLSYLNLSCNNLSGEIPLGIQLQSFSSSSFVGNRLCGAPLTVKCNVRAMPPEAIGKRHRKGGGSKLEEFYLAMVLGFVVGFWGICGPCFIAAHGGFHTISS